MPTKSNRTATKKKKNLAASPNRVVTTYKLAKLKDHPRQAELFGDIGDAELVALVSDMRLNGLRHPIEILPDGTVVAGHQRARAAARLGWKDVAVVVLHDLAARGAAAVEAHLVGDNFVRRHLTPLAKARCVRRLVELRVGAYALESGAPSKEAVKAAIAAYMGLSPRTVNRYLLVMNSPVQVQAAFDRGDLTLIAAGKVAMLDRVNRDDVARRIEAGEKPATVVREATRPAEVNGDAYFARKAFVHLARALARDVPVLTGRVGQLRPSSVQPWVAEVQAAIELLTAVAASVAPPAPPGPEQGRGRR